MRLKESVNNLFVKKGCMRLPTSLNFDGLILMILTFSLI